jgi:chaperone modulatory protein CbpM
MIVQTREFVLQVRIESEKLEQWVAAGWLLPHEAGSSRDYSDVDLARAHLIRDLQELGVNDDGIPIILHLVDQLHGLRCMVRELVRTARPGQQADDSRS